MAVLSCPLSSRTGWLHKPGPGHARRARTGPPGAHGCRAVRQHRRHHGLDHAGYVHADHPICGPLPQGLDEGQCSGQAAAQLSGLPREPPDPVLGVLRMHPRPPAARHLDGAKQKRDVGAWCGPACAAGVSSRDGARLLLARQLQCSSRAPLLCPCKPSAVTSPRCLPQMFLVLPLLLYFASRIYSMVQALSSLAPVVKAEVRCLLSCTERAVCLSVGS